MSEVNSIPLKSPKPKWQLMTFIWMALLLTQGTLLILEKDWISGILGWNTGGEESPNKSIGEVVPKSGETLFQRRGEFSWNPATSKVSLARRDGILTGEDSESEIIFEDGLTVLLGPRTWIEMDRAPEGRGTRIRLRNGSLRVTKGSQLPSLIEFAGGSVTLPPAARVDLNEGTLQVRSGEAILKRDQTPEIRVAQSESVSFTPGGAQANIHSPMLAITEPDSNALADGESLSVKWSVQRRSALEAPMTVQLSLGVEFKPQDLVGARTVPLTEPVPPVLKTTLKLDSRRTRDLKKNDRLYLRVISQTLGAETASPTILLRWAGTPPPANHPITRPPPPPEDFDLEIKRPKAGKKRSEGWKRLFFCFAELFWIHQAHASEASIEPSNQSEYNDDQDAQVTVKWRAVEGAAGYSVQASDTESFKRVVAEAAVVEPQWQWNPPAALLSGQLYFRVASKSSDGQIGGYSRAKQIALPTLAPPPAFSFGAQLHTGVANFVQVGGNAGLSTAYGVTPYFQQKLTAEFRLARETDQFALEIAGTLASFNRPNTTPTTLQPSTIAGALQATLLRHSAARRSITPWSWAVGLGTDWTYRWQKTAVQVLEPRYAFALGPAASIMRNWGGGEVGWQKLIPRNSELKLRVPLTGLLTQGNWGLATSVAAEWKVYSHKRIHLSLRAETEGSWTRFQDSSASSVFVWAFWLAPVLQWGAP